MLTLYSVTTFCSTGRVAITSVLLRAACPNANGKVLCVQSADQVATMSAAEDLRHASINLSSVALWASASAAIVRIEMMRGGVQ